MEWAIGLLFRFFSYMVAGLSLEMIFSVTGIEKTAGAKVNRRVPHSYLEGFVSLYMIPLHGLGMLFFFELARDATRDWHFGFRYLLWCVGISAAEALWGWLLDKTLGFYPWDYYAKSKYKVFERGYTLWTLVPQWGLAGMFFEVYSDLLRELSPQAAAFVLNMLGLG
jgi:hypothetical protein